MARYGLTVGDVQAYIEMAIGGMPLTTTVERRERFHIRVRYAREWRDACGPEIAGSLASVLSRKWYFFQVS